MLDNLAKLLAGTAVGAWALREDGKTLENRGRPSLRVCLGLALVAASYVIGPLGLGLCIDLALEQGWTLLLLLAGGGLFLVVHLLFAVGVYLAGADYAKALFRWSVAKFLRRHLNT